MNLLPTFDRAAHDAVRRRLRQRRLRRGAGQGAGRRPATTALRAEQAGAPRRAATPASSASACRATSRSPARAPRPAARARTPPSRCTPTARATILTGTSPHGQGHATAWAMLASDELGIPIDKITVKCGDTDLIPKGGGTGGSRSLQQGGAAVQQASRELLDVARERAADVLEAEPGRPRRRPRARRGSGRAGVPGRRGLASPSWPRTSGCSCAAIVHRARRRPSRSARTSRWSRSTPRPARSAAAPDRHRRRRRARCSTRCSPRASGTAASPRARRRRLLEEVVYDADGNPLTSTLRRLPVPVGDRGAQLRAGRHGDADHLQPARAPRASARPARSARPRPCRTPSSTPSRTSASATSTCRPPPSGSGDAIQRRPRRRRADAGRDHGQRRAASPTRSSRGCCSCTTCASVCGLQGHQRRLRHHLLRRLHRAARRRVGEVVHGARRPGRRPRGDDARGPGRRGRRRCTRCRRRSAPSTGCSAASARRAW